MIYAKISNNAIIEYPANPALDNPNVSFPFEWNGGAVNDNEYVVVQLVSQPQANLGWYNVQSTPEKVNDVWYQSWDAVLYDKPDLKYAISKKRYEVEIGGVVVSNNTFSTDRESQTKYVAVALDIIRSNSASWSIDWKTSNGTFVTLDATQMNIVIDTVRNHVQSCFNKEKEYLDLIDVSNTSVLESTDFSAGWPSNS